MIKRTILAISVTTALAVCGSAFAQVAVTIDTAKPGPVIDKNVYGQFAEHLGTGIYEGMWVGPNSKIPNTKGWRNDVVGALKELRVPLVRWPGGCFADEYHWKDGIGPRNKRPVKVNTNWGNVTEDNAVGTHEFFDLAELLGSQVYINGNLGTGSVQEMSEWIEYMTSPSKSTLAEMRRKNGRDKPWKVDFFAVGNEMWGCGGNMNPEHYANLYKNTTTFIRAPQEYKPKIIASGGHTDDVKWADVLTREVKNDMAGVSFHYYTIPTGKWEVKGAATGFPESQWFSTMQNTLRMDKFIRDNKAVMDKNDPEKKVGLFVDEWGTWYDVEPGTNAGFLYQQNSLRDAVVAALNFNIFHEHADRVRMTNIAQMVNVLQAMILTDKTRMVLTPTYHAYKMYVPFQDATSLPVALENNTTYSAGSQSVPQVSASAARAKDGKVYLALVNTDPNKATEVTVNVGAAAAAKFTGQVLTAAKMDAHNTFDAPNAVKPASYSAQAAGGKLTVQLPAKSVIVGAVE
ncbi:alpha-N-arabinofuranosidase [Pseudoduganella albidiflava]|uniref:non-reducing end alpha-L-arabinofuranosidase n=1 Tax=Pseudoduganella albidiflava TaxID=321983 RepID=A0A411WW20_9BURK|nr:alpha-L-arabinofuranosidase C-terminal domain-containing protein [Pseudoduganella albidiflava]QBI00950.1 alpha-N-arabinofuranosidase [Pseudoduganella albidiflava]GGY60922.1 alpha-L-arabinofuranosidase [Pseudoduganella albidiflava]